ncbi:MAG: hypothetical protein KBC96_08795 [Armatimonadetes bacterium]|nr:hypothetical protein [Armatimonadota bacterium]
MRLSTPSLALAAVLTATCVFAEPSIRIRNNYDFPYKGPVVFSAAVRDGVYEGRGAKGAVSRGKARILADVPARSSVTLDWNSSEPRLSGFTMFSRDAGVDYGLVVIPGREGQASQVPSAFSNPITTLSSPHGIVDRIDRVNGYRLVVDFTACGDSSADVDVTVTRVGDGPADAYIAFVRRVTMPQMDGVRMRWNGIVIEGTDLPAEGDRITALGHGVDWLSWKSHGRSFVATSKFTPGYTYQNSVGRWALANYFYAREQVVRDRDHLYLITEIAGPNPAQEGKGSMAVRTYAPPAIGEPVELGYRFAVCQSPTKGWEDSQFLAYAGYRHVTESADKVAVDLGVPYVEFGTSYFPYSTMTENFDYYRTAGLDREGWWPFSPQMWEKWRQFEPQMKTDLRIIKAMGFDWVRLHHLELLAGMERRNAIAFLDFYMDECRKLGLKALIDTSGSPEWMSFLAGRYKDVVKRIEMDNEILIVGIRPGDAERWTACYNAIKKVAPDTQVFLTGACNQGQFERLIRLGVPFDRVGYHNYKHRETFKEAIPSVAVAVAGHASELGMQPTLGEFNWKYLTHLSPEVRAREFKDIYGKMLEPRAIPEFFQFQWQETLSVNPRLTRQGLRHYETINLDRRPKSEAVEFMKLVREHSRPDSPIRVLPIKIGEVTFRKGRAVAEYTIENRTGRQVDVRLSVESFQGASGSVPVGSVNIMSRRRASGLIELRLDRDALPGAYHYFLKADYPGGTAYGWGIASNPGVPKFDAPVLADKVEYPQGADVVAEFDYSKPICIAFGVACPIIELEMAYQARNALQSAIGREIRLCSTDDIPKGWRGNLILVGTPQSNPLIAQSGVQLPADKGAVVLHDSGRGRQWLVLAGRTPDAAQAAGTDFVLRFWKNARDSAARVSGLEQGAALGNKAAPGDVNLP